MPDSWCIYHVPNCIHAKPEPKNKYVAIVCTNPCLLGFLINTEIHPFILGSTELLQCQVKILVSHYKFLRHTSYIDCKDPYQFKDADLTDYIEPLNIITKAEILRAVRDSRVIEMRYQKMILSGN